MIAKTIELLNPVANERGNGELRKEIAEYYGVSVSLVAQIWYQCTRYRCDCCGNIKLPADFYANPPQKYMAPNVAPDWD